MGSIFITLIAAILLIGYVSCSIPLIFIFFYIHVHFTLIPLIDPHTYSCQIKIDESEPNPAPAVTENTLVDPDAFIRYHNLLNVTLNTLIEIAFNGEIFWPSNGGTVNISAGETIKVSALWADGTDYIVEGTEEVEGGNFTETKFTYHGLDLYAFYDSSVPAGFVILPQKRVAAQTAAEETLAALEKAVTAAQEMLAAITDENDTEGVEDIEEVDTPATDAPTTESPATDAPATDAPATDAPATNDS